jgi:hypothetical protein
MFGLDPESFLVSENYLSPSPRSLCGALSGRLSLQQARQAVSHLERAVERLEKNVNARLLAEVTLLDLPRVF